MSSKHHQSFFFQHWVFFPSENEENLTIISTVTEERDLGIVIDGDLKFTSRVDKIVKKANKELGTIKHTIISSTIRLLYITLVRPILDYGSTIWNPHLTKNICKLEAVQRRAINLIPSFYNISYSERLQQLNLPSLLYHRTRMDLIITYRILITYSIHGQRLFFYCKYQHPIRLYKNRFKTSIRGDSFSNH